MGWVTNAIGEVDYQCPDGDWPDPKVYLRMIATLYNWDKKTHPQLTLRVYLFAMGYLISRAVEKKWENNNYEKWRIDGVRKFMPVLRNGELAKEWDPDILFIWIITNGISIEEWVDLVQQIHSMALEIALQNS